MRREEEGRKESERVTKGWSKGGGGGRVESAKRQRGQIPRDSVLSSGAASTPGTRNSGEGVAGAEEAGGGRTNQLDACALGCSADPSGFPLHSP